MRFHPTNLDTDEDLPAEEVDDVGNAMTATQKKVHKFTRIQTSASNLPPWPDSIDRFST